MESCDTELEESLSGKQREKLSKSERKLAKKQAKARHTLLKHEGLQTSPHPTRNILVANGGLGNGIEREEILLLFGSVGPVDDVVMLREKPYCFVKYGNTSHAIAAMQKLHGHQLRRGLGPDNVVLYLSFVESVPSDKESNNSLPPGLVIIPDFVDEDLEQKLLDSIVWESNEENEKQSLKHRRVQHHGYEFNYATNNVDTERPLPDGMPALYSRVIDRIMETGHVKVGLDQLTINQYQPGQGIPPHVDTHSAFEDSIVSLSLNSQVVMDFGHPDGCHIPVVLPRRSLLVMTGEARYMWTHGITPKKTDVVPDPSSPGKLTLQHRGQRTSFTFRAVRGKPCKCNYPRQCDSQRDPTKPAISAPKVLHPKTEEDAARLEADQVHTVYDSIAEHFSGTRYKPWPRVVEFLDRLQPGSIVLDVGCGNGKYLGVNRHLCMIGCDRSNQLIGICRGRSLEGFVCDSLSLPVRDRSVDACICIAVIHHLSTMSRRIQAVKEISRVLRSGGQALVTVWAMEQEHNEEKSKYIASRKGPSAADAPDVLKDTEHLQLDGNLGKNDVEAQSCQGDDPDTRCNPTVGIRKQDMGCDGIPEYAAQAGDSPARTAGKPKCLSSSGGTNYQEHGKHKDDSSGCSSSGIREAQSNTGEGVLHQGTVNKCSNHRQPEDGLINKQLSRGCTDVEKSPQTWASKTDGNADGAGFQDHSRNVVDTLSVMRTDDTGRIPCENDQTFTTKDDVVDDKPPDEEKGIPNSSLPEAGADPCQSDTIAVHKNRTKFERQDLLVPWHLRGGVKRPKQADATDEKSGNKEQEAVFYRYYHVFVEGEMEKLCETVEGVQVVGGYYDQGNWCVIFQKS
ncbi:tRNA (carboxymethyluridine(34)-5-O)-methyltransferase ALKBH8-like [Diadema antillarum]|uniref:tRNA (carboxymethyluridine(34)-5-O)-methyltransferase ALKBH8-like n=1 Tax=Diadema antillarum TaxID=105358 RepID=UPI003A879E65